jgi:hypothetical protein
MHVLTANRTCSRMILNYTIMDSNQMDFYELSKHHFELNQLSEMEEFISNLFLLQSPETE